MNISIKSIPVNCSIECDYKNICCQLPTEIYCCVPDSPLNVLFIGQGGGETEEKLKRPFVGKAGQYLKSIIRYIISDLNIKFNFAFSNIVRFRPMTNENTNRDPTEEEINKCLGFLKRDIFILNPSFLMPLGLCAAKSLIDTGLYTPNMSSLRGSIYKSNFTINNRSYHIVPSYHPSYLCRKNNYFDKTRLTELDNAVISDILTCLE